MMKNASQHEIGISRAKASRADLLALRLHRMIESRAEDKAVDDNACRIDDFGPLPIVRPQSVREIGDIIRRAGGEGQAIYPIGGRTLMNLGLPPARPGVAVDLRSLSQ